MSLLGQGRKLKSFDVHFQNVSQCRTRDNVWVKYVQFTSNEEGANMLRTKPDTEKKR